MPIEREALPDKEQITSIIEDIVQCVRQGDISRFQKHIPTKIKRIELSNQLQNTIDVNSGEKQHRGKVFFLNIVNIDITMDSAIVKCEYPNDGLTKPMRSTFFSI